MDKTDFESLDNLMKKIVNEDEFDKFDIEQAKILLAKIKFLKSRFNKGEEEQMTRTNDGMVIPKDATHMLIVCDTFSYEDYTVFAFGEQDLKNKRRKYTKNMQRINQIIPLRGTNG